MSVILKKAFLACLLALVAITTGAWQGAQVALAESQDPNTPATPLYPGLTWNDLGSSTRDIRINVKGDSISLSGESHEVAERLSAALPQAVLDYYSNEQLAKSGWASDDAFEGSDGVHYVFYHEDGFYLSVDFLKCPDAPGSVCVSVWKSEQIDRASILPVRTSEPNDPAAVGSFNKTSPANGATNLNPESVMLTWGTFSPTPDKYSYCVKEGSACEDNDPNWTGTNTETSVTITNLDSDKTYYWQVKAITCIDCVPKEYVYADAGTWWTFKTRQREHVIILGNAGVPGAILSYTDGTLKTVTADGAGSYSIRLPIGWSGTLTPTKPGYVFSPKSASFSNVTAAQTIQNFTVVPAYVISGNTGVPGVTLSYTEGTPQTVLSDGGGNYSIIVPQGWSGTVTPSKTGYTFSPTSRTYANVTTNQTAQNYTVLVTISGNTGVAGVTLSYTEGTPKTATSLANGNYSFQVLSGWSGTVTPSKTGYNFSPVSRSYTNVTTNKTAQNYTAVLIRYTISGNVGASGITLSYTDGIARSAISQGNGNYSFTVPYNWSGTVTPAPTCFTFTPTSKTYGNVTANQTAQNYAAVFNGASGCSNISIDIGGVNQGSYGVAPQTSTRASFVQNSGPVKATSPNAVPFLIAERDAWLLNGVVQSFSEMIGLPGNQVTDTYYFPWYNNVTMDTQLRFANLGNTATNITVTIAGNPQPVIPLAAGVSTRVSYQGINAGPVKVQSSGGVPIIVAERDAWLVNGVVQSFSEMMGLPGNQLSTTYYFPWYNNVTMNTKLRLANLGNSATNVLVTIAGQPQTVIPLSVGESTSVSYPLNAGPVQVASSGGVPIIVAEQDTWLVNGVVKSFSEMMGLPGNQLTTSYYFPWYNNVTMDTQLRLANPSTTATNVTVTIAGVAQPVIPLAGGESTRISYPVNAGPVKVTSSGGVPIIVAERDAWLLNGVVRSFSEMMGLPGNQLTTTYYFPWYNNITMDTQLRFAVP